MNYTMRSPELRQFIWEMWGYTSGVDQHTVDQKTGNDAHLREAPAAATCSAILATLPVSE